MSDGTGILLLHDAHCPSGTARFAHLPDAPEYQYD